MNILDEFTDDIIEIDISNKNIEGILDFTRFTKLYCQYNKITSLNNLPNSVIDLKCDYTIKDYDKLMKKYNKQ